MSKKIKIYLCDCVHNYLGVGTYMFPLNIGYLAAYAKKFFPNELDIKLFKYPGDFIEQFKKDVPDIVGFSHYTWNADLDIKFSEWVKCASWETMVVFGGPNINNSALGYKRFFSEHNSVDFYIPYQGEIPFVNILKGVFDNGLDIKALKRKAPDGAVSYDKDNDFVVKGREVYGIKDLDSIPSPYQTGILDGFFNTPLIPIVETNRGCPYMCTFCAQGLSSHNRVDFFSLERVKDDLVYIADRVKNTNILNFADANFGIAQRDMEIAQYVADLREKTNYPRKFNTNWAKNQPRLVEIAKILNNCNLIISLQSLDEAVLKNTRRSNIKLSVFRDIVDNINTIGGISGTEVILGLPGETKESHIRTLRQLFDWDVSYIINYNALILEGTEMSLDREKGKFPIKTKFRLIDNSFGKYDSVTSFEAEEGIRSTETMSEEEILYFRPVHWLIQFLWNYRFYFDLLKYLQSLQINPLDYILKLIDNVDCAWAPEKIKNIFNDFKQDANMEWFESPQTIQSHYAKPENFRFLEEGQYGKLNGKYIFRVLVETREDFEKYLYRTAVDYSSACLSKKDIFEEILKFLSASIVDFAAVWEGDFKETADSFKYDILAWRALGYKKDLENLYRKEGIRYSFCLPSGQSESIRTLLGQYKHINKNVTLRKMSEFMDIRDLFYKAKPIQQDKIILSAGAHRYER